MQHKPALGHLLQAAFSYLHVNVLPSIQTSELATNMIKATGNSSPNLVADGTLINKLAAVFFFLLQDFCH